MCVHVCSYLYSIVRMGVPWSCVILPSQAELRETNIAPLVLNLEGGYGPKACTEAARYGTRSARSKERFKIGRVDVDPLNVLHWLILKQTH